MKLIILENNLRERLGHFLNSTIGLANEAALNPLVSKVDVFANKRASREVLRLANAQPLFRHVSWHRKTMRTPLASIQELGTLYSRECQKIGTLAATDIILVPTAQENQVFGLAMYLESLPPNARPWVVLNFHVDNWTDDAPRKEAIRDAFLSLEKNGSDKIIVTAQTPARVAKLSDVCGKIIVRQYPLPQNYDLCVAADEPVIMSPDPVIAILGRPMKRKGSADISEVIYKLRERPAKTRFNVQTKITAPSFLKLLLAKNVSLMIGGLSPQQYGNMLSTADILMMPYDPETYRDRTSGIFCDCAAYGKVAVVPADTWMAGQISEKNAAGVVYEPGVEDGLVDAISHALENLAVLRSQAKQRANYWWQCHSAKAYIDKLLSEIDGDAEISLLRSIGQPAENDPLISTDPFRKRL